MWKPVQNEGKLGILPHLMRGRQGNSPPMFFLKKNRLTGPAWPSRVRRDGESFSLSLCLQFARSSPEPCTFIFAVRTPAKPPSINGHLSFSLSSSPFPAISPSLSHLSLSLASTWTNHDLGCRSFINGQAPAHWGQSSPMKEGLAHFAMKHHHLLWREPVVNHGGHGARTSVNSHFLCRSCMPSCSAQVIIQDATLRCDEKCPDRQHAFPCETVKLWQLTWAK